MKNLRTAEGTFTYFVNQNAQRLATLKTQPELFAFLEEGIKYAVDNKSLDAVKAAGYLREGATAPAKRLHVMIYNISLAGENLKVDRAS